MLIPQRKRGLNGQQQYWFDVHYLLDDMDIIREDIHRIANSLEELVQCQKHNQ